MATYLADARPRTKRQYQPSIDTYLYHRPSDDPQKQPASPSEPLTTNTPRHAPDTLPHSVQSSLLSVGMRIRKAVPEGYKNQIAHEAAKSFQHALFGKSETLELNDENVMPRPPQVQGRPAELAPMCGIHKIGGYGVGSSQCDELQNNVTARPSSTVPTALSAPRAAQSSLSADQQCARLQQPRVAASRKRVLGEDEDEALVDGTTNDVAGGLPMALDSTTASTRRMAVAVSRHKRAPLGELEQPPARPPLTIEGDGMDFGEADFLQPL
ncbi:MAG: hypothetical protein M1831_002088 [Alyxoria varia]|nr:MAG: hypothetical protein M1831_002088 [Alyxoria varia]